MAMRGGTRSHAVWTAPPPSSSSSSCFQGQMHRGPFRSQYNNSESSSMDVLGTFSRCQILHNSPQKSDSALSICILQLFTSCYSCKSVPELAVLSSFKVSLFLCCQTACIVEFSKKKIRLLLRLQICFSPSVSNFHCLIVNFILDKRTEFLSVKAICACSFCWALKIKCACDIDNPGVVSNRVFFLSSSVLFSHSLAAASALSQFPTCKPSVRTKRLENNRQPL